MTPTRWLLGIAVVVSCLAIGGAHAVPRASGATASPLITGRVIDGNGNPVAGATVVASVWPDTTSGDFTPKVVSQAVTDSQGGYSLDVSNSQPIDQAEIGNGGVANFELDAYDAAGLDGLFFFDAGQVTDDTMAARGLHAATLGRWLNPATGSIAIAHTFVLKRGAVGVSKLKFSRAEFARAQVAPADDPNLAPCVWVDTGDLGYTWGVIGELHAWDGQTDTFHYGTSADSDVQVGLETGTSWGISGSAHVGNSTSSSTAAKTDVKGPRGANRVEGRFDRHSYLRGCDNDHMRKVTSWDGLDIRLGDAITGKDGNCSSSPYRHAFPASETGWGRNSNNAIQFSAAFDLGPLEAEATSGYSTDVASDWDFPVGAGHVFCGSDAAIDTAHRVFVGD